jgi:hypothetical protein
MSRARRGLREFICTLSGDRDDRGARGSAGVALDEGGLWFSICVPGAPLVSGSLVRGWPEAPLSIPLFAKTSGLPTTSVTGWRSSPEVGRVSEDLERGRAVWVEVAAGEEKVSGKLRPVIGAAREYSAR